MPFYGFGLYIFGAIFILGAAAVVIIPRLWRTRTNIRIDSTSIAGGKVEFTDVDFASSRALYFLYWIRDTNLRLGRIESREGLIALSALYPGGGIRATMPFTGPQAMIAQLSAEISRHLRNENLVTLRRA